MQFVHEKKAIKIQAKDIWLLENQELSSFSLFSVRLIARWKGLLLFRSEVKWVSDSSLSGRFLQAEE